MSSQLPMRTRWHRAAAPAAVLALTLGLAACGESDEDEDAATPTTQAPSASPSTEPAGGSGNLSAFCDAAIEVEAVFSSSGPEGPDQAQLEAAFEEARTTAPADIASDVDRFVSLTEEAFAEGADFSGPPPPEFEEIDTRIDEYLLANCDFSEVSVNGTEYAYEGIPETVDAGQTAFTFTNEGGEEHEFILIRVNDDVTQSIQELAALPEEEVFQMIRVVSFTSALPGGTDYSFVDLEPGRYGALCFIPVGSTPEAIAAAEAAGEEIDGPPHFTQGMVTEFTVE
ncbi:MAG: hypothetical protein M3P97_10845 [Actinomycetota bacterium]|nr:hypothetical protein [Actinomycetota bacterium]